MPRAIAARRSPAPRPARQARSVRSLEAILEAAEALLRRRDWRHIGIVELCRRAGVTTGAFYARFRAKDDLLPFLYSRYDASLADRFAAALARATSQGGDGLRARVSAGMRVMVDEYRERRWLLRAMALWARQNPEALGGALRERRRGLHDGLAAAFLPFQGQITHPDPALAVRTGLFMAAAAARDKILFGEAPHAAATPLGDAQLAAELSRALYAYLTC
jgi:AcrR family transcriptional regulator